MGEKSLDANTIYYGPDLLLLSALSEHNKNEYFYGPELSVSSIIHLTRGPKEKFLRCFFNTKERRWWAFEVDWLLNVKV